MSPSTPSATGSRSGRGLGKVASVLVALVVYALIRVGAGGSEPVFTAEEVADEHGLDSVRARIVADQLNTFADSALELPRFRKAFEDVDDEERAFRTGAMLSARGFPRLADATIDTLARLRGRLLERLSTRECAQVARGDVSSTSTVELVARLDTVDLRRILSIGHRASLAELSNPPRPRTTESEMQDAWTSFGEALAPREVDRFVAFVETTSPSPEDLCWAERTVWRVIPELDPRDKKVLLRMIAQEAGNG